MAIPKFTQRNRLNLKQHISKLGLRSLFTEADLSNMVTDKNNDQYVEEIIQECVVIVDEYKTEAAAAAVVCYNDCCSDGVVFIADHTFIYSILHEPTQTPVFLGMYDGE